MSENKKFFYGSEISEYGVKNGYIDYRCFAKAFDAVLNNSIMTTLENAGYYFEGYNVYTDNSEEISDLEDRIADLEDKIAGVENENIIDALKEDIIADLKNEINAINEEISDLEELQECFPDIYQYYIVSDNAISLLDRASEVYFYCEELDMYIWGVTHYGTSWDYVLTNIKIDY